MVMFAAGNWSYREVPWKGEETEYCVLRRADDTPSSETSGVAVLFDAVEGKKEPFEADEERDGIRYYLPETIREGIFGPDPLPAPTRRFTFYRDGVKTGEVWEDELPDPVVTQLETWISDEEGKTEDG